MEDKGYAVDEVLFENKWLQIRNIVDEDNAVSGYTYSHEARCGGEIVSIMPFRNGVANPEMLMRFELTPCWTAPGKHVMNTFTGGVEDIGADATAVMELREESGYIIEESDLIKLGTCRGTKSSDTLYHLYAVDVTDKEQGEQEPHNEMEAREYIDWVSVYDLHKSPDPMIGMLMLRYQNNAMEEIRRRADSCSDCGDCSGGCH